MIEDFLRYLEKEKRYSGHTLTAYGVDLKQFDEFLSTTFEVDGWEQVTSSMVRTWLVDLNEKDISSKSVGRKLSSVKSFYKFLQKQGHVKSNPAGLLSGPKVGKRLPEYISEKEANDLVGPGLFPDTWEGLRDRVVINLLYDCGLRRSEVVALRDSDIDMPKQTVKVLGKGNKERIIPLRTELIALVKVYIEERDKEFDLDHDALLITGRGKPIYAKAVYNLVVHYMSLVTSNAYKGPHALRHSFATHLTNAGAEIKAVQDLLGHASLAATQVYTHNNIEKLKRAYKQAHPKA
jgi:integrase/recombinase XerC